MSQIEIATIEKKIEQTKSEIESCSLIDDELLKKAFLSELEIRLDNLTQQKKEIEESSCKETIKLRIFGNRVEQGRISSRTLVTVLDGFIKFTDSIANAVINMPSEKGRIPQFVQETVDFQVVGTFAGSFGIILEKVEEGYPLIPTPSETDAVLNEIFTLLETNGNEDELLNLIVPSGRRAIENYKAWLAGIEETGVDVELAWENRVAEHRKISVYAKDSSGTISVLDDIENIEDSDIGLTGVLTGINIRNNRFEMTVEGLGVIKGNGKFETLIAVSELMGKEVQSSLIRSITYSKAGNKKISWYLVNAALKSK